MSAVIEFPSEYSPTEFKTREEWLLKGAALLKEEVFKQDVPEFKVSVGFSTSRRAIGSCFIPSSAKDNISQVFISPTIDDPVRALDILAHEMIHAILWPLDPLHGHGPKFKRIARAIGLSGPLTATHAGPELEKRLKAIVDRLGAYPHAALSVEEFIDKAGRRKKRIVGDPTQKRQKTRLLKVVCPSSGYTARVTRKWLDAFGAPISPVTGLRMKVEQ